MSVHRIVVVVLATSVLFGCTQVVTKFVDRLTKQLIPGDIAALLATEAGHEVRTKMSDNQADDMGRAP